jgi:hypothetical protein
MKGKIFVGISTFNRSDYCRQVLNSLPGYIDCVVVCNDGHPYSKDVYGSKVSSKQAKITMFLILSSSFVSLSCPCMCPSSEEEEVHIQQKWA